MDKKLSLAMKFRVIYQLLKIKGDYVFITCGYCKSANITFSKPLTEEGTTTKHYSSVYSCNKCGSSSTNHQMWIKDRRTRR